jgi:hypothetical protein
MVKPLVLAPRYGLGHLLRVAPPSLKQVLEVRARGVFYQVSVNLELGKARREKRIELRERGGDRLLNAIRILELTSQ